MLGRLLDVLFPNRCAGCGNGPWPFCPGCGAQLIALAPPWCERCGVPWRGARPRCPECPPPEIDVARAPFLFHGPARHAVHRLKYAGWRPVAAALGGAMVAVWPPAAETDAVTWVPLSRRRLAERGFDQARALAEAVGAASSLGAAPLLERTVDLPPQARRSGAERRAAVAGAFRPVGPCPPRVLLVDDVLTTGATAGACARALRAAGARHVAVLTAARAVSAPLLARYTGRGLTPGSVVARGTSSR
ncbi:MAG TPA: double zinc ribbon domain-containing protein [Actinomycetota bacterium]|nr:double zinc ribbon domain-containing protein [Actinomycetota bacterium]